MGKKAVILFLTLTTAVASSLALTCYSRAGSATGSDGQTATCNPTQATCYAYLLKTKSYAGCGACPPLSPSSCSNCSTDNCNYLRDTVYCYIRDGSYFDKNDVTTSCATSRCYQFTYSYGVTKFYFAGCGNCTDYTSFKTCTDCASDMCNFAASSAAMLNGFGKSMVALVGVIMVFALV